MLLDGGVGALPKVLEAYMGEVALSTGPSWSIFGNLLWVVVMVIGNTMINSRPH